MTLQTRRLTYDEYLKTPETKQRYEIVDGQMIMAPSPSLRHQTISQQLFLLLHQFITEHQLGRVWYAPLDILVQREPLRTRQPDLLFVSHQRADILKERIEGGPDLVVEILSPGNTRAAMEDKLADYARLGVRECWLVSPEARTVEVLELHEGSWKRIEIYGLGDQVQSRALAGLSLAVAEIFA